MIHVQSGQFSINLLDNPDRREVYRDVMDLDESTA
jgi:hypothetical protein